MAPDVLTIPTLPQLRLKALLQANALLHAVLAGFCFMFRASLGGKTTKTELGACLVGFGLAFHAVFLFRIAMKQPVSSKLVAVAAVSDLLVACGTVVGTVLGLVHTSQLALRFLIAMSALQGGCGVGLVVMSHLTSHGYTQPEVIAI